MAGLIAAVVLAVLLVTIAGLVERGYVTRVWRRSSRIGRGRRYDRDY
jgi:hypothetical protein